MQILMQFWQLTGLFLTSFVCKKTLIILCLYKVLVILAGFGGLVKHTQKIAEAIVRGLD